MSILRKLALCTAFAVTQVAATASPADHTTSDKPPRSSEPMAANQSAASSEAAVSIAGTWELNIGSSTFTPGTEIKKQTRTYSVKGTEVRQVTDSIDAQGRVVHSSFKAHYDGKEYPLEGNPDADSITVTSVDAYSAKSVLKKDGKVVQTVERALSKDGKSCTFRYKGVNAAGKAIDNTLVFDRR